MSSSVDSSADLESIFSSKSCSLELEGQQKFNGRIPEAHKREQYSNIFKTQLLSPKTKFRFNRNLVRYRSTRQPSNRNGHLSYKYSLNQSCDNIHHVAREELNDFYEEADTRMSRNSLEYPEEQAKQVVIDKWLSDNLQNGHNPKRMSASSLATDEEEIEENLGNVIGIRGFPKSSSLTNASISLKQTKELYCKLEAEYLKLSREFMKFKRQLRGKKGKTNLNPLNCPNTILLKKELSLKNRELIQAKEHLRENLESLRINDKSKNDLELRVISLTNQVENLKLEPNNKITLELQRENQRLKDLVDVNMKDNLKMQEDYGILEAQLKDLLEEQKQLELMKSEDNSKMLIELCRLQVYQPKLEMILNTEREIKRELEFRIASLEGTNSELRKQVVDLTSQVNEEILQSQKRESIEIGKLVKEIARFREECESLRRERGDFEESNRILRLKLQQLELRHQTDLELKQESASDEINRLNSVIRNMEANEVRLGSKLDVLSAKLEESEQIKESLMKDLLEVNHRLQLVSSSERTSEKLLDKMDMAKDEGAKLTNQIALLEMEKQKLRDNLQSNGRQLEKQRQQIDLYKQRFKLQQKAYDDLKEAKDAELLKCRTSLSFEQNNRRATLKGMEKELKVSLKELESMKSQFSKRPTIQRTSCSGALPSWSLSSCSCSCRSKTSSSSSPAFSAKLISQPNRTGATK